MTAETRYRLTSDNDGHRYVIPADRSDEWEAFLDIPSRDPRSWEVPDFARAVDGGITFTDPRGCDGLPV